MKFHLILMALVCLFAFAGIVFLFLGFYSFDLSMFVIAILFFAASILTKLEHNAISSDVFFSLSSR